MNKFQPAGTLKTINGSILSPHNAGLRFVLNTINLSGKPEGSPLMTTFDKKWRKVREEVKGYYATRTGAYKLGAVLSTAVQSDTWVVHMLCQNENLELDSSSLETCLKKVAENAKYEKASVHISENLLKEFPELRGLISSHLLEAGVPVYLYAQEEVTN